MSETDFEALREPLAGFGRPIVSALAAWAGTLARIAAVTDGQTELVSELHGLGREYGLTLVSIARTIKEPLADWDEGPRELDPRPLVPLLTELGESYVVLMTIESPDDAARAPLISLAETRSLVTPEVVRWLDEIAGFELRFAEPESSAE